MTAKISLISPCYNEADGIEAFYHAVKKTLDSLSDLDSEIILVDDGSTDGTSEVLKRLARSDRSLKVLFLSRNFGHQTAISAGIDSACGDALIMMDSDLQHPVELIPTMIEHWHQGFDIVSAVRKETQGAGLFKSMTSKGFYFLFNKLSPTYLPPGAADFCLLSKKVYTQLRNMKERHRFLRGMICWLGFRKHFVSYTAANRSTGASKYSLIKMLRLASVAIFSFSSKPLTAAIRLGLLLTSAGFLYLLYILYGYFVRKNLIPGWASLIGTLLVLNGFQLIFIGLIGEYIAKIFEEVKGRPVYVVMESLNVESSMP